MPRVSGRRAVVGDAAIAVLAGRGLHGLTHRAVDAAAGLPAGSTSYYARTRAALLDLVLDRLTELDRREAERAVPAELPTSPEQLAEAVAGLIGRLLGPGRDQTIARYELALEATRRPRLRAGYDAAGRLVRWPAEPILAALGSRDPRRHARMLVAWCDGVLFDAIAGAGGADPTPEELRRGVVELLRGMLRA